MAQYCKACKCDSLTTETFRYSDNYLLLESSSNMSIVGGRIKYYRKLNNLSQRDIYEKISIDKSTYIRYESDTITNSNLKICNKICVAIGIDPKLVYDDYMTFLASDYNSKLKVFKKKFSLTMNNLEN